MPKRADEMRSFVEKTKALFAKGTRCWKLVDRLLSPTIPRFAEALSNS
ncbi:hypothetical protein [Chroococcidiopsis sp. CCMEE 29]|nr:hypothetical protein [Chroococcidiopsis sp. CCMEE 29]